MVSIASHQDLIVGRRADDEVRQLKALLFQTQADASASLRISPRMAAASSLGMPRSKPIQRQLSTAWRCPRAPKPRRCRAFLSTFSRNSVGRRRLALCAINRRQRALLAVTIWELIMLWNVGASVAVTFAMLVVLAIISWVSRKLD
jgi:hypothetical protein